MKKCDIDCTTDSGMVDSVNLVYKLLLAALFLVYNINAITDPFTRSCPSLVAFTGRGIYAFEGTITSLVRDRNGYLTAEVRVGIIYHGARDLAAFETILDIQRAYTCGHLHRVGNVRLWVVQRQFSKRLIAKASLANLPVNLREIRQHLRGRIAFYLLNPRR